MEATQKYQLLNYLYGRKECETNQYECLRDIWDSWHCMLLIEANLPFFDRDCDNTQEEIEAELHKDITYLNLNSNQSLILFKNPNCDYILMARKIYTLLKLKYEACFHLAVSSVFYGHEEMPGILKKMERWLESKFYHIMDHILTNDDEELDSISKEALDYKLIEKMNHDVNRKDAESLTRHFARLAEKYRDSSRFSAVYVKFVFSNVVDMLFQDKEFADKRNLAEEISEIYSGNSASCVVDVARRNIDAYLEYLKQLEQSRNDTMQKVIAYMDHNLERELNSEVLGELTGLDPGYLSTRVRQITGVNLFRRLYVERMEKAKVLLENEKLSTEMTAKKVGYRSTEAFFRMYYSYFGEKLN